MNIGNLAVGSTIRPRCGGRWPRYRALLRRRGAQLEGSGAGKTTLLYEAYKDVNGGHYFDYPAQTIGDCVSHGFGHGIDLLSAVQIAIAGRQESFEPTATEPIYAMARVDVGGQRGSTQDGAVGAWAARPSPRSARSRLADRPLRRPAPKLWAPRAFPTT